MPKPVAFEIPIENKPARKASLPVNDNNGNSEGSIVKKHPPRRLQRLEEISQTVLTVKEIEEKQRKAEERRLEIMEEKIKKAQSGQKCPNEKVSLANDLHSTVLKRSFSSRQEKTLQHHSFRTLQNSSVNLISSPEELFPPPSLLSHSLGPSMKNGLLNKQAISLRFLLINLRKWYSFSLPKPYHFYGNFLLVAFLDTTSLYSN